MNSVLAAWNNAVEQAATEAMLACCGASRWATEMVALRPITTILALSEAADRVWAAMDEPDWLEAFACHPRIGERKAPSRIRNVRSLVRAGAIRRHQRADRVMRELAEHNLLYEQRFGFTYIVCATGKSADEMLAILKRRLANDRMAELREAAEQQRQIMQIRLGKWLLS